MLEAFPPRRDPRPLVLVARRHSLQYAALDAWEVRGVGQLSAPHDRALRLALARLVLQVKPSAIVVAGDGLDRLAALVEATVRPRGLPVVVLDTIATRTLTRQAPPLTEVIEQFPELRVIAVEVFASVLSLAVAVLAHVSLPKRLYARLSISSPPFVASRGHRGPRPLRVPHGPRARRSRPCRRCPRGRPHGGPRP